ncbi:MAG: 2-aminoethylphosphonate--pyruvate transaminase [Deferribacterales bacterium]
MHGFDNNYLLLTPGPLSTTEGVRGAMMFDVPTRDKEYFAMIQDIRAELVSLASDAADEFTAVLVQGSGTYAVESMLCSAVGVNDRVLIAINGAYGYRMAEIAKKAGLQFETVVFEEDEPVDVKAVADRLWSGDFTHFAVIHLETTTGILNPVLELGRLCAESCTVFMADCMSSFGSVEFDMKECGMSFMAASSNKCLQGVPGVGLVVCRRDAVDKCKGNSGSVSLDLYDQYSFMESTKGGFRFTSPTHIILGLKQALEELREEGGVKARSARYRENQRILSEGIRALGFKLFLTEGVQSPVITTIEYPSDDFNFEGMYAYLKENGFYIYPGKLTKKATFRIGTIGNVHPDDIRRLLGLMEHWIEA